MAKNGADGQHDVLNMQQRGAVGGCNLHPDAAWFRDGGNAGLFIHYGLAAVSSRVDLSWGMMANKPWETDIGFDCTMTPTDYFAMAERFRPLRFEEEIRRLTQAIRECGFTYAVFTTRHHDGFALWPSRYGDYNIGRVYPDVDLVKQFTDACRDAGLKIGLYYSPPDWHFNRNFQNFNVDGNGPILDVNHEPVSRRLSPSEEHMTAYYQYLRGQLVELLTGYGKIDMLWFDGGVDRPDRVISMKEILDMQPGIVMNDRMLKTGDFATFECRMPAEKPETVWEQETIWAQGPWWGFMEQSSGYRPLGEMLEIFDRVRAWSGNWLLNVGPKGDGSIPTDVWDELRELKDAGGLQARR